MNDQEIKQRYGKQGNDADGIRVYYVMAGTKVVCSDVAVKRIGAIISFKDGGWMHANDAYLTAAQARQAHGIDGSRILTRAAKAVGRASDQLIALDEWLTTQADEALS